MARPLLAASLCLVATLGPSACASSTAPTSAPAHANPELSGPLAASATFQADYEAQLRADEQSFLTAVAAYYVQPDHQLGLSPDTKTWAPSEDARLRLRVGEQGVTLELDGEARQIKARTTLALDAQARFSLVLSPQESSWRVLVHDRDADTRRNFPGIDWFPLDAAVIVEAHYLPDPARAATLLQTSRGETKTLYLAGALEFELDGHPQRLQAFAYTPELAPGEELLVPFRDATTGRQSYAAGRYLELHAPAEDEPSLTLDFNRATNPLCAYSEHYNCPMPPRFNALEQGIEAGARAPAPH